MEDSPKAVCCATRLWKRTAFRISYSIAFSKAFRTLRDMVQDIFIDPSKLHHIKFLGEGKLTDPFAQTGPN